ncbi:glycosyltransferase family 2 protein [Chengkuizengella sp. SCS-71B]|uniref:glycosyltransferase family 2 protein n=1 Tax=Chengkuizengella sp. SCS-71B TaxID=3115290 RepID=UPI0032C23DA8
MDVSVIIPVYNQPHALDLCLEGFCVQTTSQIQFEIIIVDDGSEDDITPFIKKWEGKIEHLIYIRTENVGRASARNMGLKISRGNVVVLNDADRIPDPHFIQAHHRLHRNNSNYISVGQIRELYFSNIQHNRDVIKSCVMDAKLYKIPSYCKMVYQCYNEDGMSISSIPWISTFSGNLSFRRSLLERVGMFEETFLKWGFEHFELGYRAFEQNYQFIYNKSAINYHLAHKRPTGFYKKSIEESLEILYRLHPNEEMKYFKQFFLGSLSLQQLEHKVSGKLPAWNHNQASSHVLVFNSMKDDE